MIFKKRNILNKKGSAFDVLFILFLVVIMGIAGFILTSVWNDIYNPTTRGNVFNQTSETASIGVNTNSFIALLDYIVPTVLFFGIIIIGVLVYSNPIPPPFLIFGLLFSALLVYFALVFKEMYLDMLINSSTLNALTPSFPITHLILQNIAMYILFLYALIVVVTYSRGRGEQ